MGILHGLKDQAIAHVWCSRTACGERRAARRAAGRVRCEAGIRKGRFGELPLAAEARRKWLFANVPVGTKVYLY